MIPEREPEKWLPQLRLSAPPHRDLLKIQNVTFSAYLHASGLVRCEPFWVP